MFISAVILGCKVVFEVWHESLLLFLLFLTAGKERQWKTKNQKPPKYVYWFGISSLIFLFIIHFIIIEVTLTCCHRVGYKGQFKMISLTLNFLVDHRLSAPVITQMPLLIISLHLTQKMEYLWADFRLSVKSHGGLMEDVPHEIECTCRKYWPTLPLRIKVTPSGIQNCWWSTEEKPRKI